MSRFVLVQDPYAYLSYSKSEQDKITGTRWGMEPPTEPHELLSLGIKQIAGDSSVVCLLTQSTNVPRCVILLDRWGITCREMLMVGGRPVIVGTTGTEEWTWTRGAKSQSELTRMAMTKYSIIERREVFSQTRRPDWTSWGFWDGRFRHTPPTCDPYAGSRGKNTIRTTDSMTDIQAYAKKVYEGHMEELHRVAQMLLVRMEDGTMTARQASNVLMGMGVKSNNAYALLKIVRVVPENFWDYTLTFEQLKRFLCREGLNIGSIIKLPQYKVANIREGL